MNEERKYEESLYTIIEELDRQLEVLSTDSNTFHNAIIELIANKPDSKELVQFIVAINDKLETKQDTLKEVLSDSLRTLIVKKIEIFKAISEELSNIKKANEKKCFKNKVYDGIIVVQDHVVSNKKTYIYAFLGILLLIALLIMPDKVILVLKMFFSVKGV